MNRLGKVNLEKKEAQDHHQQVLWRELFGPFNTIGRFVGGCIVHDLAYSPYHATDVYGPNLHGGVHAARTYNISPRFLETLDVYKPSEFDWSLDVP